MIPLRDYNPSGTVPVLTIALIVANVGVFGWQVSQPPRRMAAYVQNHGGLVPARFSAAVRMRDSGELKSAAGSIFTSLFLHGGVLHLLGNMWFLWLFGDNVEDRLGHVSFLLFYTACGVIAGFTHLATNWGSAIPCVGASGAISGVLGGYLVAFPRARIETMVPVFGCLPVIVLVPAGFFLVLWFLMQFYAFAANVAWQAHVGGFVAGVILSLVLPERRGFRVRWRRARVA